MVDKNTKDPSNRRRGYRNTMKRTVLVALLSEDSKETELIRAGLVPEEMEFMGEKERQQLLEAAGLDPNEYDF